MDLLLQEDYHKLSRCERLPSRLIVYVLDPRKGSFDSSKIMPESWEAVRGSYITTAYPKHPSPAAYGCTSSLNLGIAG